MTGKILTVLILFGATNSFAGVFQIKTKEVLKRELGSRVMKLSDWVEKTNDEGFDMLCLGESHIKFYRNFYAEKVLSKIKLNTLALESQQDVAVQIHANYVELRDDGVDVTGVAINPVTEAVYAVNPDAKVYGVEKTQKEGGLITFARLDQLSGKKSDDIISRDGFIAEHVDSLLEEGTGRVAALYGSKHCAKYATKGFGYEIPFYRQLMDKYGDTKKMVAVHIITSDKRSNPLRAYADDFGFLSEGEDIVVVNPGEIAPKNYNYHRSLMNIFQTYDVVILTSK
ncbi:MAG: hypothetical protein ACRBBP_02025 [Bdellovibrionales bacterium]